MIAGATESGEGRGHRTLPHTADAGIEAVGPDLPTLFEEAAFALAESTSDIDAVALLDRDVASLPALESVRLTAADPEGLAYAWLAELVGRIDIAGAIAAVQVEAVSDAGEPAGADRWSLRARVAMLPFDGERVRRAADVKAVTYHRLAVVPTDQGWRMTAYLDL